jgi:hypothetical protein
MAHEYFFLYMHRGRDKNKEGRGAHDNDLRLLRAQSVCLCICASRFLYEARLLKAIKQRLALTSFIFVTRLVGALLSPFHASSVIRIRVFLLITPVFKYLFNLQ